MRAAGGTCDLYLHDTRAVRAAGRPRHCLRWGEVRRDWGVRRARMVGGRGLQSNCSGALPVRAASAEGGRDAVLVCRMPGCRGMRVSCRNDFCVMLGR